MTLNRVEIVGIFRLVLGKFESQIDPKMDPVRNDLKSLIRIRNDHARRIWIKKIVSDPQH